MGVLGPSESGKSQFIKLLLGLVRIQHYHGRVNIFGKNYLLKKTRDFNRIGYCLDHEVLEEECSLLNYAAHFGKMRRIPHSLAMRRIFILAKILELDAQINTKMEKLSEGSKRKASLLVSMLHAP